MPDLISALLCDFAQVREGLLFVSSGGISRLAVQSFPQPLNAYLALSFEVAPDELGRPIPVRVALTHAPSAQLVGSLEADVPVARPSRMLPGENLITHVALRLAVLPLREAGPHDLRISVGGELARFLTLHVLGPQPPGGG